MAVDPENVDKPPLVASGTNPADPHLRLVGGQGDENTGPETPILDDVEWEESPGTKEPAEIVEGLGQIAMEAPASASKPVESLPAEEPLPEPTIQVEPTNAPSVAGGVKQNIRSVISTTRGAISTTAATAGGLTDKAKGRVIQDVRDAYAMPWKTTLSTEARQTFASPPGPSEAPTRKIEVQVAEPPETVPTEVSPLLTDTHIDNVRANGRPDRAEELEARRSSSEPYEINGYPVPEALRKSDTNIYHQPEMRANDDDKDRDAETEANNSSGAGGKAGGGGGDGENGHGDHQGGEAEPPAGGNGGDGHGNGGGDERPPAGDGGETPPAADDDGMRTLEDGSRSNNPSAYGRIDGPNYGRYVTRIGPNGEQLHGRWGEGMQPLSYEEWAEWQRSLREPPEHEPPAPGPEPPEPEPPTPEPPAPEPTPREEAEPPGPPIGERIGVASEELRRRQDDLARFTILRRGRAFDWLSGRGRANREAYEQAELGYEESLAEYLRLRRDQAREADASLTEARIEEEILNPLKYSIRAKFIDRVKEINDENYRESQEHGGVRGWRERMLWKWANASFKKKLMIGLVVGVGAGAVSATLGLGLAGIAVGVAAKYSLGFINQTASARNYNEKSYSQEKVRNKRREIKELTQLKRSRLRLTRVPNSDEYLHEATGEGRWGEERFHRGEMQRAQWKNRAGWALVLASGAAVGLSGAELAGAHIPGLPNINLPGWWHSMFGGGGHAAHHAIVSGGPEHLSGHWQFLTSSHGNWHDTIWHHVQEHSLPGQNLHENVQRVLNMNAAEIRQYARPGESLWQTAHHLPIGFRFRVPEQY